VLDERKPCPVICGPPLGIVPGGRLVDEYARVSNLHRNVHLPSAAPSTGLLGFSRCMKSSGRCTCLRKMRRIEVRWPASFEPTPYAQLADEVAEQSGRTRHHSPPA